MGLGNFLKKLFKEEEDNTAELVKALVKFTIKMKTARYEKDGNVCFDPRTLATSFGMILVCHSGDVLERDVLNYFKTLSKEELFNEYHRAYVCADTKGNNFYDFKFPNPDHPGINYPIKPLDYMHLVQKRICAEIGK